jgi:nucleotide-binding universal stress UspA family protein
MKILLAVDGSEYSDTAAGFMQRVGLWGKSEVTIAHILKDYIATDEVDAARDFKAVGERAADRLIDETINEHAPKGAKVGRIVREGDPWHEIMEASKETDADLIVMGHRGVSGIKRFMVGSMVHKVARHSDISVLVVRELPLLERPMRILFCTDGSYASKAAREFLADLPISMNTDLHVLAVVDMDVTSLPEEYYPEEDLSVMMRQLRERYNRMASQAIDGDAAFLEERVGHVTSHLEFGAPDEEILKKAGELDADLIVMGCRGVKGIRGMLVGSASHRVLRHSYCSVLVVKSCEDGK